MRNTKQPSLLLRLVFAFACLMGSITTSWADTTRHAGFASAALAVIYDKNDEFEAGAYDRILAGIQDHPDVVVFRVALNSYGNLAAASDLTPVTPSRAPNYVRMAATTGGGNIAVLYPDIGEPFRSVFSKIIQGIEEKTKSRVISYPLTNDQNLSELSASLRKQGIRVVIALGRHGLKAASSLDRDNVNIVAGGVLGVAESEVRGMSVFSLAPDPSMLFTRLRLLLPNTKRVFVVYDPKQNNWLIRLARDAARANGLELVAYEASDLKSAIQYYQDILRNIDPNRDALWLPQDPTTVEESTVLPLLLQESWNRNWVLFSSSLGHVKRGALFSLYPNNHELGRNLASTALASLASDIGSGGIVPLREAFIAVNVRTASHLGMNLGYKEQQSFDMVFPEP